MLLFHTKSILIGAVFEETFIAKLRKSFFYNSFCATREKQRLNWLWLLQNACKPIDLGSDSVLCLNFIAQVICYMFIFPSKLSFAFMEQYWSPPVAKLIILRNGVQVLPRQLIFFPFPIKKLIWWSFYIQNLCGALFESQHHMWKVRKSSKKDK